MNYRSLERRIARLERLLGPPAVIDDLMDPTDDDLEADDPLEDLWDEDSLEDDDAPPRMAWISTK